MKRIYVIGVLLILSSVLKAQSYNSYFNQFELKTHYGITIPHHDHMRYIINSNIAIVELDYSIKTDGSKPWHHTWRFPEIGVGYLMGGLGNINILGFSQSAFIIFGIPIVETDKFLLKYRLGGGVGYISDKFDSRSNYYNIAVGSNFNAHLQLSVLCDYKPFDIPLYFTGGFAFNHFSNGAIETPNLGLNQITANIGVKYLHSIYTYSLPRRQSQYMYNSELELSAYYAAAVKENSTYENKKYFINSIVFDASLRVSKKRSLGGGINIIYDPSLQTQMEDNYKNISNLFRIGIHAVQELYLTDELTMPIYLGTYVLNSHKPNGKNFIVYSKVGIRYTFKERFFVNINLKTHISVADYIEFGVGMRLY
ncbi:MAG: acyloxyacyl hydrolase [Bacteroidales bacterium]|nr:acyloxyacyl hydrolase [Bacteroidales bacterium]